MKNLAIFSLAAIVSLGSATSAVAHHSSAPHFHRDVSVTLDATVTDWKFVNPHAYVYFDVTDNNGEANNWRCELASASSMTRDGWTAETFSPGQELVIDGSPAIREDHVCHLNSVTFADGVVVTRGSELPESYRPVGAQLQLAVDLTDRPEYLENGQPNISGYWVRLRGPGGGQATEELGLTAMAKAVQAEYEFIYDVPSIHCDIGNIIFGWTHGSTVNEVKQFDNRIELQYGYMDYLRAIHLDMKSHPDDIVPTRGGHSIGHWDGDTLVVDTKGFLPGFLGFRTSVVPHSDQMHSVERFWIDDETEALVQSYVAEDPTFLNNAYTGQNLMQLSAAPYEPYDCVELSGDNNIRPQ